MTTTSPSKSPRDAAFSLVEVTIAMAIAAVALLSIMAMIPQGLGTMRDAGDQAIIARIHQQVLSELQLTPFEDVTGASVIDLLHGVEIYYDAQGEELGDSRNPDSSDVVGRFDHIYTARVHLPDPEGTTTAPHSVGGASFPGGYRLGEGPGNADVRPVIIEVAPVGGRGADFDWESDALRRDIHTYQTIVVKMTRDFTR